MPETPMSEKYRSPSGKNEIRASRQFPNVEPVSKTEGVQPSPKDQFGFRIFPSDARHHSASDIGWYGISHGTMESDLPPSSGST
jgi:hypothetical protein